MLLPHEVCYVIGKWNKDAGSHPFTHTGLTPSARHTFSKFCRDFDKDVTTTFPLGFWIDGVPVKWDRSESIIVFTLNFAGQVPDTFRQLRIPITLVNKKFVVEETMADILGIIAWSFLRLHAGFFPSSPFGRARSFYRMEVETLWPSFASRRSAGRDSRRLGSLQTCFWIGRLE